jgi:hypothetical protein
MVVLSDSYNGLHGVENLRGIRRAGLNFDGSQFARLQSLSEGLIGAERYPSALRSLGDNQVASHGYAAHFLLAISSALVIGPAFCDDAFLGHVPSQGRAS